ncbi:MAG: 6-hydroxypseudooxynicotine dehydrogenase complex subunit gamma [Alphaproteobacteria bacterium MarineAlpha11_Bin1]|nr:MAG: 6-hydroxypseudooxynicotine dehydrogenase complex subunit gamma [Alphaproteobacteria bacterium MarineAlpha11_Bin1]|tara:strand:- start:15665 stop:17992 length:2328 start_codon:yes stop_codon:yes gene_type:complete
MKNWLGDSPRRKEDWRLLTGRGQFADDNSSDGQLYAFMLASVHAHAELYEIDTLAARAAPGIVEILTGADWLADDLGPIPHNMGFSSPPDIVLENRDGTDRFVAPHYPLPADRVRHVGEPVAMVIAESYSEARDAAELIKVNYMPLTPIIETDTAASDTAPTIWPDHGTNVGIDADVNDRSETTRLLENAEHVVKLKTKLTRVSGVAMEPRSSLGEYDADGRYTLQTTAGSIYRYKRELAELLGSEEKDVRIIIRDAGGSYGPRNALYVEHALVLWAAKRLKRPVKWTSDRTESMLTDYQARDLVIDATIGFDKDGKIVALDTYNTSNIGAHSASWIPLVKGIEISTVLYRVPSASARAVAVQTNTPPTYPYRSAGRPEVMYAMERMIDMAAEVIGLDRIEIRRINLIAPEDIPYTNNFGLTYDSGDYPQALDEAVFLSGWHDFQDRRVNSVKRGRLRGIGIANYADLSTGYPREWTEITVQPEGIVEVQIGTMPTGQGHQTAFSQMVAEVLQAPYETIEVGYGDTDLLKDGGGTHSGRSMRMGAIVLSDASAKLISRATRIAAYAFEAADTDIEYSDAMFTVIGTDRRISLFDIALMARDRSDIPEELKGDLKEDASIHFPRAVIGSGCHVCEVEIDPETGLVDILNWTAVDDVGRAINPMTLDGQTHGSVMQGVGQALMEDCAYDIETGQMIGATFADYAMPRADTSPPFQTKLLEIPSPSNPLGIKPGSEGGTAVAPAAVANAIVDALKEYGVDHIELPATPERVWRAINRC